MKNLKPSVLPEWLATRIPKEIIFVDALPTSAYGKVEKIALRQQFAGD